MKKKEEGKKELSRIPKALLAKENEYISKQVTNIGGSLMLDCLVFLSKHQMTDLFGDAWFSIDDFAQMMGYKRPHLSRKMTDAEKEELFGKTIPVYKEYDDNHNPIIEHPIENVFESILFKLGDTTITLVSSDKEKGTTGINFVPIVNKLTIKTDFSTNKDTKRLYKVELSKPILDVLFTNYQTIGFSDYKLLPKKPGYKMFYLYLTRMIMIVRYKIEKGEIPCFTMTVDQLAEQFQLNVTDNKDRKKVVKRVLDKINETLEITKFTYSFIKAEGQKLAYTIKFEFPEETLNFINEEYNAAFTQRFHAAMQDYYARNVLHIPAHQIYKFWPQATKEEENKFFDWLYSSQEIETKKAIYDECFIKSFGCSAASAGMNFNPQNR